MTVMVGYPVKWRDYSTLKIDPADLYGNVDAQHRLRRRYQFDKVGKPVDREEWAMTPQTVDAYNGGLENKIVFPAGILQPPLFNPAADPAVNYGAIGAIIGHEITHGFDDQGRKIDATGALRDWWTPEDAKRFVAESDKLARSTTAYEAVPGHAHQRTADAGREHRRPRRPARRDRCVSRVARRPPAPVIDGFTGDQRFFLGYAQAGAASSATMRCRRRLRPTRTRPAQFRVIGPLAERRRLVCRVQRRERQVLPAARRPGPHLVTPVEAALRGWPVPLA